MLIFNTLDHERYTAVAIEEAKLALEAGDPPIGAVIVCDQNVISTGRNRVHMRINQGNLLRQEKRRTRLDVCARDFTQPSATRSALRNSNNFREESFPI
jgi:deoxycytidylate deaminase